MEGVRLRLVFDESLEHLSELVSDGTAHKELSTNADGEVVLPMYLVGSFLRVEMVDHSPGVMGTLHNAGDDSEKDSDLGSGGLSDRFSLTKEKMTEIDLGSACLMTCESEFGTMPSRMESKIRVRLVSRVLSCASSATKATLSTKDNTKTIGRRRL